MTIVKSHIVLFTLFGLPLVGCSADGGSEPVGEQGQALRSGHRSARHGHGHQQGNHPTHGRGVKHGHRRGHCGHFPPGEGGEGGSGESGCLLEIQDASVSGECSSLLGYFYTYGDDGYTIIEPGEYGDETDDAVCASGHAPQVIDEQYDIMWGAGVGVFLAPEMDGEVVPYDAIAEGVVGFAFNLTGVPSDGQLRFHLDGYEDEGIYCSAALLQEGYNEVLFSDLTRDCWDPESESATPDLTRLENMQWQIVTNSEFGYDYDFCISDIRTLQ